MEINVYGRGLKIFTPDEVILNINFNTKEQTYEAALANGVKNVQLFVEEILLKNGFTNDDMKTRNFVVRKETKYNEPTKTYVFDGFSFNQSATVKFDYDKERVAKIMEALSKMPNAPSCNINFGVKNEKECKRNLIAAAYKDAELQAQAIADAAGKRLVQCAKVDFKPFTTTYVSPSSFGSDVVRSKMLESSITREIVETFIPEDIEISESLYCLWIAE